jgi:hypothetical protein
MTRQSEPDQSEPDPMATYGEQLHELLTEAFDLAQSQLESEPPNPDVWQLLAQRTYTFRSGLPSGGTGADELQAFAMELEHTLLARSRLESQPPQRVLFFGETLLQARRTFDREMTQRLMPLAEALAAGQPAGSDE